MNISLSSDSNISFTIRPCQRNVLHLYYNSTGLIPSDGRFNRPGEGKNRPLHMRPRPQQRDRNVPQVLSPKCPQIRPVTTRVKKEQ